MAAKAGTCRCPELADFLNPVLFKALCEPNRAAILARLARGCEAQSVSQVCSCCSVDMSVVSRHLAVMRDAGILEAKKSGKEVLYSVRYPELVKMLRGLADAIEACCPPGGPENKETQDE